MQLGVFDGPRLVHAIKRAKRWMLSNRFKRAKVGIPHHIALKIAAFHKADPAGFKAVADKMAKAAAVVT